MIHSTFLINFVIDLVITLILTGLFYYQRHKRRDLFVSFTFFNIAMFVIVTMITKVDVSVGASFGLFALLGIIRLRNEEFNSYEIAYFFGCLALAMINGLGSTDYLMTGMLNGIVLIAMGILDHPSLIKGVEHSTVALDAIYNNDDELRLALEKLLNAHILSFSVSRIDNVRDTMSVKVGYRKRPALAASRKQNKKRAS